MKMKRLSLGAASGMPRGSEMRCIKTCVFCGSPGKASGQEQIKIGHRNKNKQFYKMALVLYRFPV
jgi:hypothetical protein